MAEASAPAGEASPEAVAIELPAAREASTVALATDAAALGTPQAGEPQEVAAADEPTCCGRLQATLARELALEFATEPHHILPY